MRALNRKLLRDLWRMRAQAITVALSVACGVTAYVASASTWASLERSRDRTYRQLRFAHVFAHVQRAPQRVLEEMRALPGVARVEARVTDVFRVEVPGFSGAARGRFVSLPPGGQLNQLFLRSGALPRRDDEVVVSELFAKANLLRPGDTVFATIVGRRAPLRVSGVATAPDFLWVIGEGSGFGDERRDGVFWMSQAALAPPLGMQGAFNEVALEQAPGVDSAQLVAEVERVLAPWGSFGAYDRRRQVSSRLVDQEIGQLRGSATVLPAVFLSVASFLVNVLLSRVVGQQREQIAALKAFGYSNRAVATHYLAMGLVMVVPGTALGIGLGTWVGGFFLRLYEGYFRFPELRLELPPKVLIAGALISTSSAALGALFAVRRAVRLAPAEAMRPEAPRSFRATVLERLGLHRLLPIRARMVMRDLERRPVRTALSAAAVAAATAILVAGYGSFDSVEALFGQQFEQVQREDLLVAFTRPLVPSAALRLAREPGVTRAEAQRTVPVRLRAGPRSRESSLTVVFEGVTLRQLLDAHGRRLQLPARGLLISRALAKILAVGPGDPLEIELLEGKRAQALLEVAGVVDDTFGLNAWVLEQPFFELTGEPHLISEVLLQIDRRELTALEHTFDRQPWIAGVTRPEVARDLFRRQTAEIFLTYQVVLAAFAFVIAVGVVYNNARIAFVVRGRDLASLRILGFTQGEAGAILVGEQLVQLGLGVPLGLPLGKWLLGLSLSSADPELYRLPLVVSSPTYATAALLVLSAGLASSLAVTRQLRRQDLVSVLKARD